MSATHTHPPHSRRHLHTRYLVDHVEMAKEYFYQRTIRNFSHFPRIVLQPAVSLRWLLRLAYANADIHIVDNSTAAATGSSTSASRGHDESGSSGDNKQGGSPPLAGEDFEGGEPDAPGGGGQSPHTAEIEEAVQLLVSKADMLDEYYRIGITPDGE
jgi:hypothetical protein